MSSKTTATSGDATTDATLPLTVAQVLDRTKSDPRFERGRTLLKEKRYEEAVVCFEDLLRTMIELQKEADSLAVAPVYYEYGHALLALAEATASVFGSRVQEEGAEGDVEEEAKETDSDLQVAWEMLEIARVIYTRFPDDAAAEQELARVYTRLGDHGMESEVFDRAKADYEKSLLLRKKILKLTNDPDTTPLADLYCCLAISCIYADSAEGESNEKTDATATTGSTDKLQAIMSREEQGFKYYVLAGRVMSENIYRVAAECAPELQEFVKQRIPLYTSAGEDEDGSASTPGKGKGKKKAAKLELEYKWKNMSTMRHEFIECAQRIKATHDNDGEEKKDNEDTANADGLSKTEDHLLEFLEIYTELKEKVDSIKESQSASEPVSAKEAKPAESTTTVGFGAVESTTAAIPVNVIAVKKRKLAPQVAVPTKSESTNE